jgi:hypothetical protein
MRFSLCGYRRGVVGWAWIHSLTGPGCVHRPVPSASSRIQPREVAAQDPGPDVLAVVRLASLAEVGSWVQALGLQLGIRLGTDRDGQLRDLFFVLSGRLFPFCREPPLLFSSSAAFTRPFGTESSHVAIIMERRGATCRYTPGSDLEGEGTDTWNADFIGHCRRSGHCEKEQRVTAKQGQRTAFQYRLQSSAAVSWHRLVFRPAL